MRYARTGAPLPPETRAKRRFPDGFVLGAATSSHQVEGACDNDWTDWEAQPGRILGGDRSGDACGWWAGRAEEDLSLAASLGHGAHRLSLEWSRIEPEPGRFDDGALARYAQILAHARRVGLRTFVTLNHFTLPRWIAARGGWLDTKTAESFARYAIRIVTALGEHVDWWATLNEPSVLVFQAYAGTRWPPGLGDLRLGLRALGEQLRAHALAYRAVHAAVSRVSMGIVLNAPLFEADRASSRADRAAAAAQDWAFTGNVLAALDHGVLLPPCVPRRVEGLARSFDWLGLNYYGRYAVRFDRDAAATLFGRHVQEPTTHTADSDWGQPCARGLREQLLRFASYGAPVFVTENGLFDPTDAARPDFLRAHLHQVHVALSLGADVRGYFHWSLVDNFEWHEGWSTPFGLVAVDRATGKRTVRASGEVYAEICRSREI